MSNKDPITEQERKDFKEKKGVFRDSNAYNEGKKQLAWYNRIPFWVKAVIIKYWFFGLNYFLFEMGLGYLLNDMTAYSAWLLILIGSFAQGIFNDVLVYNILDAWENVPGEAKNWEFFKSKKLYSLFINIAYGLVWGFLTYYLCGIIATAIQTQWAESYFFQEPLSFAVIGFLIDGVFVLFKDSIVYLIQRRRA